MTGALIGAGVKIILWIIGLFIDDAEEKRKQKERFLTFMSKYSTHVNSMNIKASFEKQVENLRKKIELEREKK